MTEDLHYDPDLPLETTVSYCLRHRLQSRRGEIERHLAGRTDDWDKAILEAEKIANVMFNYAESLGSPDESLGKMLARDPSFRSADSDLVLEALQERLAEKAVESLDTGARRLVTLLGIIGDASHSDLAIRFLKRISRCFVFGFDPECLAMCRAAIEAALVETIPEQELIQRRLRSEHTNPDGTLSWSLDDLVFAAKTSYGTFEQRLTEATAKRADEIRRDANKSLHAKMKFDPKEAEEYVRGLVQVLNELAQKDMF